MRHRWPDSHHRRARARVGGLARWSVGAY
jgi:hypothetical protein